MRGSPERAVSVKTPWWNRVSSSHWYFGAALAVGGVILGWFWLNAPRGTIGHLLGADGKPSSLSVVSILAYSLVFGLKHAVEPDHLAAVSTIVSERRGQFRAMIVGGWWGLGHSVSILVAGVEVTALGLNLREEHLRPAEFLVALMLIALGGNALWRAFRDRAEAAAVEEKSGGPGPEAGETRRTGERGVGLRPLLVGMVHGLAGSATLLLILVPLIPTIRLKLTYLTVFGVGSILGMMAMSWLVGLPLHLTAIRFTTLNFIIRTFAGLFGVVFGLAMAFEFLLR